MNTFSKNKRLLLFSFSLLFVCSQIKGGEIGVGKILFAGKVEKGFEIFVINDDGTNEKQVTSNGGKAENPKWAPDGKCFAFLNDDHLELSNENGKIIKQIKSTSGVIQDFDWSPDGKKIVFNSYQVTTSNTKICVEDLERDEIKSISKRKNWCSDLAWAPDGQKIAFVESLGCMVIDKNTEKADQIIILDSSTGKEIIKTKFRSDINELDRNRGGGYLTASLQNIAWADDSIKIHFERLGRVNQIYFFNVSSGDLYKWGKEGDAEIFWPIENYTPVFSTDNRPEIYSSDIYGENRSQLTPDGHYSGHPMLIDHEKRVAYLSNRGKDLELVGMCSLFVMNLDGTEQKRISYLKMEELKMKYSWHFFKN